MDQRTRGRLLRLAVVVLIATGMYTVRFADFLVTSIGVVLIIIGLMGLMLVVMDYFDSHEGPRAAP